MPLRLAITINFVQGLISPEIHRDRLDGGRKRMNVVRQNLMKEDHRTKSFIPQITWSVTGETASGEKFGGNVIKSTNSEKGKTQLNKPMP